MRLKTVFVAALLTTAACATPASAWTQVGVREVRDRTERDTIAVQGPRQFERIKLCVYRNPIHIYDLDIRFRNGGRQDVSVRERLAPGQCTRAIDLNGDDRNITTVAMLYEETSFRRRTATVRVFAE